MPPDPASGFLLAGNIPAGGSGGHRPAVSAADTAAASAEERAAALNAQLRHHGATEVMALALQSAGRIALVSSFGAESVVLLHMAAVIERTTPVLFVDTEMLFTETLVYQAEVCERLGLSNVRILRGTGLAARDPRKDLHLRDRDACCALRKTRPLQRALGGFDGWITGRKRFQSGSRAALEFFEAEPGTGRIKINPLAHWAPEDVRTYMEENRLPRHPLVARGYPSIGCAPCTSTAGPGEDPRAGRWRGSDKTECGIHFVDGRMVRKGEDA
ncbi:MAG: phosphoadenylyl-sulfate reductase [Jhaorihella sp.]